MRSDSVPFDKGRDLYQNQEKKTICSTFYFETNLIDVFMVLIFEECLIEVQKSNSIRE